MKDISKVKLNITESKLREPVTIKDIADASICLYKRYGYSIEKIAKKFDLNINEVLTANVDFVSFEPELRTLVRKRDISLRMAILAHMLFHK
jgi:hypothetical protein